MHLISSDILVQRQKCGTAEIGRPERSERETLPAVATTVLLGVFVFVMGSSTNRTFRVAWLSSHRLSWQWS